MSALRRWFRHAVVRLRCKHEVVVGGTCLRCDTQVEDFNW